MEETIEELKIQITSDTKDSSEKIKKLASSFRVLQKTTQDISGLKSAYNILKKISALKFTSVTKGLNSIVTAFKALNKQAISKQITQIENGETLNLNKEEPENVASKEEEKAKQAKELQDRINHYKEIMKNSGLDNLQLDNIIKAPKAITPGNITKQFGLDKVINELQSSLDKIEGMKQEIPQMKDTYGISIPNSDLGTLGKLENEAKEKLNNIKSIRDELQGVAKSISEAYNNGNTEGAKDISADLIQLMTIAKSAKDAIGGLASEITSLGAKASKSASKFKFLIKSMGRVAFYRAIRSAIKFVTDGLKIGIQNVAQFDSKFNDSMTTLKSQLLYVRNALGAMIAPVIEMLTPIIINLTNALMPAIEFLTKLFSVMAGNTSFNKATMSVEDYAKALEEAKTSSLGIDELNVVGDKTPVTEMFKTEEIPTEEFNELKILGEEIKVLLAGFLAFKFIKNIDKITKLAKGLFSVIKMFGPQMMIIAGAMATIWGIVDGCVNGFNWKNILITLGGIAVLCIGIGIAIGGIPGLITAIVVAVVALVTFLVALIVQNWEAIKEGFLTYVWDPIVNFFTVMLPNAWNTVCNTIATFFTQTIPNFFSGVWNSIVSFFSGVWNWCYEHIFAPIGNVFTQTIPNWCGGLWDGICNIFGGAWTWLYDTIFAPVANFFTETIPNCAVNAWNGIKNVFKTVGNWFKTYVAKPVGNVFVNVINGVITGFETCVNWIIKCINSFTSNLSKVWTWAGIPAISTIGEVHYGRIPQFANGGFPTSGELFMANENGNSEFIGQIGNKTAVANNDQIVEAIKQGVFEAMVSANSSSKDSPAIAVQVYLDGKQITSTVEKRQKKEEVGKSIYRGGVLNGV